MRIHRFVSLCLATGILGACGGGSGGGPDPSKVRVTAHTEQVTFTASSPTEGLSFDYVQATVEGAKVEDLYFGAMLSGLVLGSIGEPGASDEHEAYVGVWTHGIASYVPGHYEGSLTVRVCTNASCSGGEVVNSPFTVPLAYEVSGFWSRPDSLRFGVGSTPLASDRTQTFLVGVNPSQSWTVEKDAAWLAVTPTSASGGPVAVTASLVESELSGMADGTYEGRITVTPEVGAPLQIPVTLVVDRSLQGPELVPNGGFANGTANWYVQTAFGSQANLAVVDGEARVTPVVPTLELGRLNLRSALLSLQSGKTYRLSFTARADAPRMLYVWVGKPVAPGGTYVTSTVMLTTAPRHYVWNFTMPESAQADIWLGVGGDLAPVVFDDVSVHAIP